MDIEGLSMALAQNEVITDVSTKVLSMSLDHMEETGEAMVELIDRSAMERSVMPNLGGNFEVSI